MYQTKSSVASIWWFGREEPARGRHDRGASVGDADVDRVVLSILSSISQPTPRA